jgi:hypothetical protein
MQMLLQIAATPAPAPPPDIAGDPLAMQLHVLVEQQMQSMGRLASLEGRLVSIRKQLETSASSAEKTALNTELRQYTGEIAGERARLENLTARVEEARHSIAGGTAVAVAPPVFFDEPDMFGLSQDEFKAAFVFVLAFPLVLAFTRRLWKVGMPSRQARGIPLEDERLVRLEQAVESVAIEVERIGESQRFQAKLMADQKHAPERVDAR